MATPVWIESEKRWKLRAQKDGQKRIFTSRKTGRPEMLEVNRQHRAWIDGQDTNRTVKQAWAGFLTDTNARGGPENYRNVECFGRLYILPKCAGKKVASMRIVDW